jgi:hypothetical protein
VNTSMLADELAPINAQIEQVRQQREALEGELRVLEAELETFAADRQRFDALRDVCSALDKLRELKADDLFWEGILKVEDVAGHIERMQRQISRFEGEISGVLQKQASLKGEINRCVDELDLLNDEVSNAYDREERRKEEFVIEREISPVPYRAMVMPWTKEAESEGRFRRAVLLALLVCFALGAPVPFIKVPVPDRLVAVVDIPERFVKLVKTELPKPAPVPKTVQKEVQEEPKPKSDKKPRGGGPSPEPTKLADSGGGEAAARQKAERTGVLAFKEAFADMMKETPVPTLGTEARLSDESLRVKGPAVAQRSLVVIQGQGASSGGISNAGVSRNIGNGNVGRLGGYGIGSGGGIGGGTGSGTGIESPIAGLGESSRPLSDGLIPGRTDEEIQIVFDRYKAALYRIYNNALRKDPTLRGKMLMRICIEPNGEVSLCKVESTDLASPELVAKIVERVKRFNFGPKEGVQSMTILYPIDFLPAV